MDTKKLRQKILDLAIHGKLVPQDPNDEPASVLLERIKAEKERLIKEGKIKRSKKSAKTSDTPHYQQDVPFEVPENWVWTTLGEICLFLSRGKSPKYSDTDKTYPVFAQKCNLKEGGISLEQARFLDPSTICKWSEEYKLKTGDVLVNSTGTGTVGRTRLFHESYLKHYPFVVPDSHVSVIRTASEIKSEFVFAYEMLDLPHDINQIKFFYTINGRRQTLDPTVEQKSLLQRALNLINVDATTDNELNKEIIRKWKEFPILKSVLEWWDNIPQYFTITPAGMALANAYTHGKDANIPKLK